MEIKRTNKKAADFGYSEFSYYIGGVAVERELFARVLNVVTAAVGDVVTSMVKEGRYSDHIEREAKMTAEIIESVIEKSIVFSDNSNEVA